MSASDQPVHSLESSPYSRALGVEAGSVTANAATLRLPFREENSNPGGALHGGVAASLSLMAAHAVARAGLEADSGPWHTAGIQINYLAAAMSEAILGQATLLRRGKELCFVEVAVRTDQGKPIAHATVAVRARQGAAPAPAHAAEGDDGTVDPGPMAARVGKVSFIGGRGIAIELMRAGRSRLRMPLLESNTDTNGNVHEGAALALLDTAGAMAAWAETGPGAFKASTPAIQAQVLLPPPAADLVAYGRVAQRDHELFWCDVEVAAAAAGAVCCRGTVLYRILT